MSDDGTPEGFRVHLETATLWSEDCPCCDQKGARGIFLYFGYLDDKLIVSGPACSDECARPWLWRHHCITRLQGTAAESFDREGDDGDD